MCHPYKKINPEKKAIFAEESFEIKHVNNKLDAELLSDIIEQLLKETKIDNTRKLAKLIAKKTIKIYYKKINLSK